MEKQKNITYFGFLLSSCFLILGIFFFKSNYLVYIYFTLSIYFLLTTLFFKTHLNPLLYLWMKFGYLIGKITNPIILGVIFFLLLTPLSVLGKLFKRDELRIYNKNKKDTFWISRKKKIIDPKSLYKQY